MKRDRDAAHCRQIRASYDRREPGCVFCALPAERVVLENPLAVAIEDAFPVTALHSLVIPRRHVTDYFDLGAMDMEKDNRPAGGVHICWSAEFERQLTADKGGAICVGLAW